MNTATNKMKALVAGGAALAAFGIGTLLPAQADPPANGDVGQADGRMPPGQSPNDGNNGYTCDGNHGVGDGNPAHSTNCDPASQPAPGSNGNHGVGNNGDGNGDGDTGSGGNYT